jgi:hypothetical protein
LELQQHTKQWLGSGVDGSDSVCKVVTNWCRTNKIACKSDDDPFWGALLERMAGVPRMPNGTPKPAPRGWTNLYYFERLCGAYHDDSIVEQLLPSFGKLLISMPQLTIEIDAYESEDRDLIRWILFALPPQSKHEVRLTAQLLSCVAHAFATHESRRERHGEVPSMVKYPHWHALIHMLNAKLSDKESLDWSWERVRTRFSEVPETSFYRQFTMVGQKEWNDLSPVEQYMFAFLPYVEKQKAFVELLNDCNQLRWNDDLEQTASAIRAVGQSLENGASPDLNYMPYFTNLRITPLDGYGQNKLWWWLWDQCERGAPPTLVDEIVPWIMCVEVQNTRIGDRLLRVSKVQPMSKMQPMTLAKLCEAMCCFYIPKVFYHGRPDTYWPRKIMGLFLATCRIVATSDHQREEAQMAIRKCFQQGWDWYERMERPQNYVSDQRRYTRQAVLGESSVTTRTVKDKGLKLRHPRFSYGMWRMRKTLWPNWTPPRSGEAALDLPRTVEDANKKVMELLRGGVGDWDSRLRLLRAAYADATPRPEDGVLIVNDIEPFEDYARYWIEEHLQPVVSWPQRHPEVAKQMWQDVTDQTKTVGER